MSKQVEIMVDDTKGTVRLVIKEFDRWGWMRRRSQHTFRRRQFESALRNADMVVPWQKVEQ